MGGKVEIRIEDFGEGIPKALQARIFEPFFRVDPSRQKQTGGYGLGLHLCKRIADALGAQIEVECPPAGGTCVTVRF